MKKIAFISLIAACLIKSSIQYENCQINSNIDANKLPKIPEKFQTRVEITINKQSNMEFLLIYDYESRKAELSSLNNNGFYKKLYYFRENKLFDIEPGKCKIQQLNQTGDELFGLISTFDGTDLLAPNVFFHFDANSPIEYTGRSLWRGIEVDGFKACQNNSGADVTYTYYFKALEHKPAVQASDNSMIPVALIVYSEVTYFEFNFFEFRDFIEYKVDFFSLPRRVYCEGEIDKMRPKLKSFETFSFIDESIFNHMRATTNRVAYSRPIKAVRIDAENSKDLGPAYVDNPVKFIHDFNSGVGYVINKHIGNCSIYSLGSQSIDQDDSVTKPISNYAQIELKTPDQYLNIDDSYYYGGKRYERGILCDVWISKRTDYKLDGLTVDYFVFELFIFNETIPISIHISAPETELDLKYQIFDFNTKLERDKFDISECYTDNNKRIEFAIRFSYPPGVDQDSFTLFYGDLLKENFDELLLKTVMFFSISPLRIITPRFVENRRGFTVYSGITQPAPALYQYTQNGTSNVDLKRVKKGINVNSVEDCAQACLLESSYDVFNYKCLSFDYCKNPSGNGFICSVYNSSLSTDSDVINQMSPACDHYTKIVSTFDVAQSNDLYRTIEESVIRKTFNLEVRDNDGNLVLSFPSTEIFQISGIGKDENEDGFEFFGTTSFFKQFLLKLENTDYGENNATVIIRKLNGVSIDECARRCINEPSFDCDTFTYSSALRECKWSSLTYELKFNDPDEDTNIEYLGNIIIKNGFNFFIKDQAYDYIKYPFTVVAHSSNQADLTVNSQSECAFLCNTIKSKKCRSFNLCELDGLNKFGCFLSEKNIFNINENLNNNSTNCAHYSKKALSAYQLFNGIQLGIQPQTVLAEMTAERCAEICYLEDSYKCQSFDYSQNDFKCYLYKESMQSKNNLKIKLNPLFNHYSRVDGSKKSANSDDDSVIYTGGEIFGAVLTVSIGGFIMGILAAFIYLKLTTKKELLPVMKFVNPNYSQNKDNNN